MRNSIVMGVDIGGSHITAALVDLDSRKVLQQSWTRKSVDSHENTGRIISSWGEVIKTALQASESLVSKLGIAMPGPLDYDKGVCYIKGQDKYESLYGLNIKELLALELGIESGDIRLMNDAACFLQGEVFGGAGIGYSKVMGLTLGTGLGASICTNNAAVDANLWNSPFKDSIAEDYLSSRWIIKRYEELTGNLAPNVKSLAEGAGTDKKVLQVFAEFGTNLGDFLNHCIEIQDPEAIILGGNISNAFSLFEESLKASINPEYYEFPVIQAKLGEEAILIGASSLWFSSSLASV